MDAHDPVVDQEMHELNQEADFLDQKTVFDSHHPVNGHSSSPRKSVNRHSDPDAQALVIESLRSQIQDLFSQVSQLNGKLVKSYDRVSDLEDELHVTSTNLRNSTLKIGHLEMERTQHLSALSTGLLVEKSHVTTELTRLMEKATEEAARAGEAESARVAIEKDLDDLSAGLFDQANTMVAEARLAQARSERKVMDTEQALKGAEEVVAALQAQMQSLEAEKEHANRQVEDMRSTMGKGKWVPRSPVRNETSKLKLLASHSPHMEFLLFVSHLRTLRPSTPQIPAMSTLLPLPFLARLVSEDSDPTVRLDLAPSLNWLTRRSVLSAIHSGQLEIEPMATATLLEELAPPMIPGNTHNTHIACALCGASVLEHQAAPTRPPPSPTAMSRYASNGSWSIALKNSLPTNISSRFTTHNNPSTSSFTCEPPTQVYIFRLAATSSSGLPMSLPLSAQQNGGQARPATIYPLCLSGWCLNRLRTTCSLWAFIRTSVVEKIWEEVSLLPPQPPPVREKPKIDTNGDSKTEQSNSPTKANDSKPAITPRKSRIGIGSLWGTMQRGLSGSKVETTEKDKEKEVEKKPTSLELEKKDAAKRSPVTSPRRLPPPPPVHPTRLERSERSPAHPVPPPLPKRNRPRPDAPKRASVVSPNGVTAEETPRRSEDGRPSTPSAPIQIPSTQSAQATPPSISRAESHEQDDFTTPTDEFPPPLPTSVSPSRPMSPHKVPLPASRPSTPVRVPRSPPANSPGFKLHEKASKPPSRSGSPAPHAPPPIPRRAAARTRPLSSSGVVPVSVASLAKETSPEKEDPQEKPALPTESEEAIQPNDPSVEKSSAVEEHPTEKQSPPISTPIPEQDESIVSEKKTEDEALTPPPPPAYESGPDQPEIQDIKKPIAGSEEEKENGVVDEPEPEQDNGLYVGDSTWEERTWKELVRLREEMFWARIGGLR